MSTPMDWFEVRLAALVFVSIYILVALALLRREVTFLRSLQPRERARFIVQDVLLQLSVLAILLPPVLSPKPRLWVFYLIFGAFAVLWVTVVWVAVSRYSYTWRLLSQARYRGLASRGATGEGGPDLISREEKKRDEP